MDDESKPSITLTNRTSDEYAVPSDGEADDVLKQQLEVVFDADDVHRRKSSLSVQSVKRPKPLRNTSCFVHGFLQDDRLDGTEPVADDTTGLDTHPTEKPEEKNTGHQEEHGMRSRLLSKKQLSDMAFSIRELSKRLGRVKLKLNVRNVFLLTKAHDEELIGYTREVARWLLSGQAGGPYNVYVEHTLEHNKNFSAYDLIDSSAKSECKLRFWTDELCAQKPHLFDIIIALGGDGTVLYASWLFQRIVPPVLAFALGSLGFLTKFDYNSYQDTLRDVFNHGLTVSLRLRIEATVMRAQHQHPDPTERDLIEELIGDEPDGSPTHKPEQSHDVLNDLVLDRGPNPTMSSIEVFGDDFHITTVQSDGVCVATPTGSTAYNLAAGGSLCHPDNPVLLVTAICAHTLSFRPIILPDTMVLRLGVSYDARASSSVSFDGRKRVELKPGDYVTISASRFPFPTVLPLGRGSEDWIDSLSRKLNWNSRQRQKAFKEPTG